MLAYLCRARKRFSKYNILAAEQTVMKQQHDQVPELNLYSRITNLAIEILQNEINHQQA